MRQQQQSPSPLTHHDAAPRGPAPLASGPGNLATQDAHGLGGTAPPPTHELDGPMAGLVLDVLPPGQAGLLAAEHLDNPAVQAWVAAQPDAALSDPGLCDPLLDVLWPRGLGVEVTCEQAGALPIEVALGARSVARRDDGGALRVDLWTSGALGATVAAALVLEDAFSTRTGGEAGASSSLGLEVHWGMDALPRTPARLVRAALAGLDTADLRDEIVDIALAASPDLSLAAGVGATGQLTLPSLAEIDVLDPVMRLIRPFLRDLSVLGEAGATTNVVLTALAGGAAEVRATLAAGGAGRLLGGLSCLGALLAPDEAEQLDLLVGTGVEATLHLALRDVETGTLGDASLVLSRSTAVGPLAVEDAVVITAPGQLGAVLGGGGPGLPDYRRTLVHAIPTDRVRDEAPLLATVMAILGRVADVVPTVDRLNELSLSGTVTASSAAVAAAQAAGLRDRPPGEVADALVCAQLGLPVPGWASEEQAALDAGLAEMGSPVAPRLVGRFLLGAGGRAAAGVSAARASVTARGSAGIVVDRALSPEDLDELVSLVGEVQGVKRA